MLGNGRKLADNHLLTVLARYDKACEQCLWPTDSVCLLPGLVFLFGLVILDTSPSFLVAELLKQPMAPKPGGIFSHCLKILLLFLWGQPKLDPYSLWMVWSRRANLGRRLTAAGDVVFSGGLSSNMLGRLIPDSGPNNHSHGGYGFRFH